MQDDETAGKHGDIPDQEIRGLFDEMTTMNLPRYHLRYNTELLANLRRLEHPGRLTC